jgi:hypothetical protein
LIVEVYQLGGLKRYRESSLQTVIHEDGVAQEVSTNKCNKVCSREIGSGNPSELKHPATIGHKESYWLNILPPRATGRPNASNTHWIHTEERITDSPTALRVASVSTSAFPVAGGGTFIPLLFRYNSNALGTHTWTGIIGPRVSRLAAACAPIPKEALRTGI